MALSQNKLLDFPSKVCRFNHNYHIIISIKFVLYFSENYVDESCNYFSKRPTKNTKNVDPKIIFY